MGNVLEQLPSGARVAVVRLRSLGDCVLTTPALEILKKSRPDLRVAVVAEGRFAPVFEDNPDVAAVLSPGLRAMMSWAPALCLNLHGGTRSMWLTLASGARLRAGFAHHRYSFIYNVSIPTAQQILGVDRKVHTAEHLASAIFHLGAPRTEIPGARLFATGPETLRKPYALIHPFASAPGKTWPAQGFLAIAARLKEEWKIEPVFLCGPADDIHLFRQYRCLAGAPLTEVKTAMRGASVFFGNDSGPAHIAAAFRIPSLVIFGNSDPEVWSPWRTVSQTIVSRGGIDAVHPDEVWAALGKLGVAA